MADKIVQLKDGNESAYPVAIKTISNSTGTALKFADGTMICTGSKTFNIATTSTEVINNTLYRSNSMTFDNYPVAFISQPAVSYSILSQSGPTYLWLGTMKNFASNLSCPNKVICFSNENTAITVTLSYIAIGRWK